MRTLTAQFEASLGDESALTFYMLHMELTDPVYLTTLPFNISYSGVTWVGVGEFGGVGKITETKDSVPSGFAFSLSNVYNDYVALFFNEPYQSRKAHLYVAALNRDNQLIANPYGPFSARLDQMTFETGDATSVVSVTAENELSSGNRASGLNYSSAHQYALYPGDLFCDFASATAEKEISF